MSHTAFEALMLCYAEQTHHTFVSMNVVEFSMRSQ